MSTTEMPEVAPTDIDAIRPELAELCRSHEIDDGLALRCESVDGLLDMVLVDFEQRIDEIVETEQLQRRLRNLLHFACEAGRQSSAAGPSAAVVVQRYDSMAALCHQINNPLTSLLGRAQILQMKQDTDPATVKAVGVVHESGKRIAALVKELAREICQGHDEFRGQI